MFGSQMGIPLPLYLDKKWLKQLSVNYLEYQDAFQTFDNRGNGYITTRELKFLLRSLGCNPTDSELQRIVNEVDADGELYFLMNAFGYQYLMQKLLFEQNLLIITATVQ